MLDGRCYVRGGDSFLEGKLGEVVFKVGEMLLDDGLQNWVLDLLVAMDGNVSESDHVLHCGAAWGADDPVLGEEIESVAARLGDSESPESHTMHGEIDGSFACAKEVQNDGVLSGEILKPRGVVLVFLGDADEAAADDGRLVHRDVVNHDARMARRSSLSRA